MKSNVITAALCVAAGLAATAQASVIVTDSNYGKVDFTTHTRTLDVTAHGMVTHVNLTIDFSKCPDPAIGPNGTVCIGISRNYPEEISFSLISPDGRGVNLVPFGTYRSGKGRVTVTYDDEALAPAGPVLASGTFRPANALSEFDGIDMFGVWQLSISDNGPGDPIEYFGSQLEIGGDAVAAVPEPASAAILGLGLAGLFAARRRKRG